MVKSAAKHDEVSKAEAASVNRDVLFINILFPTTVLTVSGSAGKISANELVSSFGTPISGSLVYHNC